MGSAKVGDKKKRWSKRKKKLKKAKCSALEKKPTKNGVPKCSSQQFSFIWYKYSAKQIYSK